MDWADYQVIGEALADAFPKENYMTISDHALIGLVVSLAEFSGAPEPADPLALAGIRLAWADAATGDPEEGGEF